MPLAATIIRMAISRAREFEADRGAAMITGKPQHLAGALRKLEDYARGRVMANADEQSAQMFIINPFSGVKSALTPKTTIRLKILFSVIRVSRIRNMSVCWHAFPKS